MNTHSFIVTLFIAFLATVFLFNTKKQRMTNADFNRSQKQENQKLSKNRRKQADMHDLSSLEVYCSTFF